MGFNPKKGDVICADRGLYRHYGIYAGDSHVIHFVGKSEKNCRIRRTSLRKFQRNSSCFVWEPPKGYIIFSPDETVSRAESRIGEVGYSLFYNNCEHFALWCKTGMEGSEQTDPIIEKVEEAAGRAAEFLDKICDALDGLAARI